MERSLCVLGTNGFEVRGSDESVVDGAGVFVASSVMSADSVRAIVAMIKSVEVSKLNLFLMLFCFPVIPIGKFLYSGEL